MKIKCPLCDFENEKWARFCKNCNEPLSKQSYNEENPYIKKGEIDSGTIIDMLSFLFIAAVLFFGAFGELIALMSNPYSFWWWIVFIFLVLPGILAILWIFFNIAFKIVKFIKELFL